MSELPSTTVPTVADVALLLRARTQVRGGKEAGTFNEETRPTGQEVSLLIGEASDEVLGKVQTPVAGSDYERRVRGAIRLYAAILIELSYFPEQVGTGQSAVAAYERLYESRVKALIAEGETGEVQGEGGEGPGGGDSAHAAWVFPIDYGGQINLNTRT